MRDILVDDMLVNVIALRFWAVFVLAALVLIPLHGGWLRSWAWAFINVLFLKTILVWTHYFILLAGLMVFYLLLKASALPHFRTIAKCAVASASLVLFVIHKFPAIPWSSTESTQMILRAVGFSYVALRIVELLRAVFGKTHPAPGLASMINYLLPFHMLAAGPIQSFRDFTTQPEKPLPLTNIRALRATERIAWGLFKKFVIASTLETLFLTGFQIRGWYFFVEVQLFYVWLYLDFSALSDIAVGIGNLLGLPTPENFNQPFLARNLIVFWERWHISLSQFIRRNLYVPIQLALMRRTSGNFPLWCSSVAFTISFALCGLWHGGALRFLLWGLMHAAGLIGTNVYRHLLQQNLGTKGVRQYLANRPVRIIATFVTFEFVAFSLAFMQVL
jgi:D-alanyl-lipoteichoic acid acyltransferase DltB (MBOAT superfamily)